MRRFWKICFILVLVLPFCLALSTLAQEKKEVEETYTIKTGDTLWDISSKFLKNPFLWPKLWQWNPYIANPHWIYPGGQVRLTPLETLKEEEPPKAVVEEKPKEEVAGPEVVKEEVPPIEEGPEEEVEEEEEAEVVVEKPPVFPEVRSAGFFNNADYRGIGIVLENREGKNLMAEGDIVYLAFKTSEPVLIGNKYTVFRRSELINHPVTGKKIGRKYNILGNIQVIDQYGSFYTAKVLEVFDAICKGDFIQPYFKEKMEIEEGSR